MSAFFAIPKELERQNKKLIELSRKSKNNQDMKIISTICNTTSDDFLGNSYQLALILADKFCRYPTSLKASKFSQRVHSLVRMLRQLNISMKNRTNL